MFIPIGGRAQLYLEAMQAKDAKQAKDRGELRQRRSTAEDQPLLHGNSEPEKRASGLDLITCGRVVCTRFTAHASRPAGLG